MATLSGPLDSSVCCCRFHYRPVWSTPFTRLFSLGDQLGRVTDIHLPHSHTIMTPLPSNNWHTLCGSESLQSSCSESASSARDQAVSGCAVYFCLDASDQFCPFARVCNV